MSSNATSTAAAAAASASAAAAAALVAAIEEQYIAAAGSFAKEVMGGIFVELCLACILYGVTTLQVFMYMQKYKNDGPFLKSLVLAVWILETIHTVFFIQFMYAYLISGFANVQGFESVNWGVGVSTAAATLIAICVQGYYTWRVWIVSGKNVFWTCVIGFFAVLRVGFGCGSTSLLYIYPDWLKLHSFTPALVTVSVGLGSAALVDLLVALTLSFYLKRGRTAYHQPSDNMINKILLYTVNTGAITGTASVACAILFATQKSSLIFLGMIEIEAKLYANSFLGSLNARSHIRKAGQSSGRMYSSTSHGEFSITSPRAPVVEVTRQTVTHDDHGESFVVNEFDMDLKDFKGRSLS